MNDRKRIYDDYLDDILDAIEKSFTFIDGMTYEEFSKDDKTIFAVIRALEIIGEAAKKMSKDFQMGYPDAPWKEMAGMRDKLIHDYFGVNTKVVWKTIKEDLPNLKSSLRK